MNKSAIILAAGQGTRIKSDIPKVLHKVCEKEMVNQVVDTIKKAGVDNINLVVGKGAELVKEKTADRGVSYSYQEVQLGTGHAVICAKDFLKENKGVVVVVCGDTPLIREETISKLFEEHINSNNSITVLVSKLDNPTGYGRIVSVGEEVVKIVEEKDCKPFEKDIKVINSGMYCFNTEELIDALGKLSNNNAQGEFYLTDVIDIQRRDGHKAGMFFVDFEETLGVNSRLQLSEAERILRKRINESHMNNGVTFISPENTYIGADVKIDRDVVIYPNTLIYGNTVIGKNTVIHPNCRIDDSVIKENSVVNIGTVIDNNNILTGTLLEYAEHISTKNKKCDLIESGYNIYYLRKPGYRLNEAIEIKKKHYQEHKELNNV